MILVTAVLALLLVSSLTAVSAANNDYQISFDGSQYLSTGETGKVTVTVKAGPGGSYDYKVTMTGGAKASPSSGNGTADGNFTVSVTAPSTPGDVEMTVTVTSVGATPQVTNTAKYTIHVIKPVIITATVKNTANVTAENVPLQFYADDKLLNSTVVTVPANGTKQVTYSWTAPNLANGAHTLEVRIDPNSPYVQFIDGGKSYRTTFYVGDSGWGFTNLMLAIVLGLVLFVLILTYVNRGKKKKKK